MGFEIEDTVSQYKLSFGPNSAYFGLEVVVSGMTIGEYNRMVQGWTVAIRSKTDEDKAEANMASSEYIQGKFFEHIVSWNLERKGEPVTASKEEFDRLDSRLSTVLVRRWLEELTTVPEELLGKSDSGGISPDQLTALANSSSSLQS